jgi:hypothetical protein
MKQLQEPFKAEEIEWRVGSTNKDKSKGLALAYVTNRAIQNRLDDVFGCFGWRNEYKEWKGSSQICGISVWVEERNEWITKWDGADNSNMDATKGGLSDAMKRAAYQWGIGRYLYNLPQEWCELASFGKSYKLKRFPKLPEWALPKGDKSEPMSIPDMPPEEPKKENKNYLKELGNILLYKYGKEKVKEELKKLTGKDELKQLSKEEAEKYYNKLIGG